MMNTPAPRKLLHTWIIEVIVKQHLVQIDRIDGPTDHHKYSPRLDLGEDDGGEGREGCEPLGQPGQNEPTSG